MRIRINKLSLVGSERSYDVHFKDGLNVITGPISTGKSTILEMINYCLGKSKHKQYQEVRKACDSVQLDVYLNDNRILIERPLFAFNLPAKVFHWNSETGNFNSKFEFYDIDSPSNENSLTYFLQNELEIPSISLSGQTFSFRDLFQYCYISQPKIDSENILDEKVGVKSYKRKPTLEIIFNSLNQLLHELKNELKESREEIGLKLDRKAAIIEFLKNVELYANHSENHVEKEKLNTRKIEIASELEQIKETGKIKDDRSKSLESQLFLQKKKIRSYDIQLDDISTYLKKLNLLQKQYQKEIIKLDYLILAKGKFQSLDFHSCPSCSREIEIENSENCSLCDHPLTDFDEEEEKAIKRERKRLSSKLKTLYNYIIEQNDQTKEVEHSKFKAIKKVARIEEKINSIQEGFISPFIERIETINRELGELDKQIESLELNDAVSAELESISGTIQKIENKIIELNDRIRDIQESGTDMQSLISKLSETFFKNLEKFNFPKLTTASISQRNYLPYVRGVKYDELGSLGAVTLINIAYFLSILELSLKLNRSYHPRILILDTIGKNLGTRDNENPDDEFKDSKIFRSLLKTLNDFGTSYSNQMQLIIINNDLTSEIDSSNIIAEFDGDGSNEIKYGLIDDIIS